MTSTDKAAIISRNFNACPPQLTAILIQLAGLVYGSRRLFSAVSKHEGQEVYGSIPISYQALRKRLLELFPEVNGSVRIAETLAIGNIS